MKTLSGALSTALGAPVQKPGLFIEVAFSTTSRWSSYATTTWNGQTWTSTPVSISRLSVDALRVEGELVIDRADTAACLLVLTQGMQDRSIKVWGYDAAATALADVVWLCDAVGGAVVAEEERIRVALRHRAAYLTSPRKFVRPDHGFNTLLPADRPLTINGITFRLERRT